MAAKTVGEEYKTEFIIVQFVKIKSYQDGRKSRVKDLYSRFCGRTGPLLGPSHSIQVAFNHSIGNALGLDLGIAV
jgi:hypothetical protein